MKFLFKIASALLALNALNAATPFTQIDEPEEIVKIFNYLTASSDEGGAAYSGTAGALKNKILPLSYYSTAEYWGNYVALIPGNDCTVKDIYNASDYTLTPSPDSPGTELQVERVNVFNGTNVYDAATWQIALALGASKEITGPGGSSLFEIAEHQNLLLSVGYDGQAKPPLNKGANRATSRSDGTFTYNGQAINVASQAYFFRMVTKNWLSVDPFKDTSYEFYITTENLPDNPDYQLGKITWLDWKPITGENAWGFLIGPLQTAYLHYNVSLNQSFVPHQDLSVQNALDVLYAFRCMQSPIGALYYATKGSLGNVGNAPVHPHEVSVENNASALAGLQMFKHILQDELDHEPDLSKKQKEKLENALNDIDVMIHGGETPQGYHTEGLLAFFKNHAWDKDHSIFFQGGLANDPDSEKNWKPTNEPKAVDVTTWGVSVIGQPALDAWFGFGTAFEAWKSIKKWGGFFGPDQLLWGVGYSDQDGNGDKGNYKGGILSAEWSAGAINLVRVLIEQYSSIESSSESTPDQQAKAKDYVSQLIKDESSMVSHLRSLRNDHYINETAYSTVRPADYASLISLPDQHLAYLYASKRYMIPFGWLANPLPSTASTSWTIMLDYNYNPFILGGAYFY